MAQTIDLTVNPSYPSNGGHRVSVDSSATIDNIFIVQDGTNKFRIQPYAYGIHHPSWILNTTGSKTSLLQAMINHVDINTLVIDKNFINNGTLTIPTGKKLVFNHGGMISGTGTISGGVIEADENQQIFDSTITITGALSHNAKWSPKWMGAKGDGSTNDYAAINAINTIATASSQKIISFPGSSSYYIINSNITISKGTIWEFQSGAIIDGTGTMSFAEQWAATDRWCFGFNITIASNKLYPIYNPKQFGANADFSSDDTAAIVSCLRSAKAGSVAFGGGYTIELNGQYVFDPSTFYTYAPNAISTFKCRGTFKINGSWTLRSSQFLLGDGDGNEGQFSSNKGVLLIQNFNPAGNMYAGVVVVTQGNCRVKNINIQLTYGGSGFITNGTSTGVGWIPTANVIFDNCSVGGDGAGNLTYGLFNSDCFWINSDYFSCNFSNATSASRAIIFKNTTNDPITGHTYLINIRHTILAHYPIEINGGTTANAYIYGINFFDISYETPTNDSVLIIDSTNCVIADIKLEKVIMADNSGNRYVINNIGTKTCNIYITDSPDLAAVKGTQIQNLHLNTFGYGTGIFSIKTTENPDLFTSGNYLGVIRGINKERGYKDAFYPTIGQTFPFVRKHDMFVPSFVTIGASSAVTKNQVSHTGDLSALLLDVAFNSNISIDSTWSGVNVGDKFIMTMWERGYDNSTNSCIPSLDVSGPAGIIFKESGSASLVMFGRYSAYNNREWQLITYLGTVQGFTGPAAVTLKMYLSGQNGAGKSYVEIPTLIKVPSTTTFKDEEIIEYARVVNNVPNFIDEGSEATVLKTNKYLGSTTRLEPVYGRLQYDYGYFKDVLPDINTLAFDNFNRPDSASSLGNFPYPYYPSITWVIDSGGAFGISSNKAYNIPNFANLKKARCDVGLSDNISIEVDVTMGTKSCPCLFVRGTSAQTAVVFRMFNIVGDGSGIGLCDCIAGAYSTGVVVGPDTGALKFNSGQTYKLKLAIAGTKISAFIDGDKVLVYTSDPSLATNTGIGFGVSYFGGTREDDGTTRFDNFKVVKVNDYTGTGIKQLIADESGNTSSKINIEYVTLAADGNITVKAGTKIDDIIINSVSNLAALNIGTTVAGTELVNALPITAASDEAISINKFCRANTILYFTGITSSTEVILYYS